MPALVPGQRFASLLDFKKALHEWAVERNFTPAILDSDTHRVRAGCRSSPDCPFRIRANFQEKNGYARVTTVDDVHNCISSTGQLASQDIKRAETCKLKFLIEVVPKLLIVDQETSTKTIMEVVERKYGQKIALRQAQKVKALLAPKSKGPCSHCGKAYHKGRRCPLIRKPTPEVNESTLENNDDDDDDDDDTSAMQFDLTEDSSAPQSEVREECHLGVNGVINLNGLVQGQPVVQGQSSPVMNGVSTRNGQNRPLVESNISSDNQTSNPGSRQTIATQNPVQTPLFQLNAATRVALAGHNLATRVAVQPTAKTPQETRMEAAKLMQQAARLMQEAAKLNAEAARLTASVANS